MRYQNPHQLVQRGRNLEASKQHAAVVEGPPQPLAGKHLVVCIAIAAIWQLHAVSRPSLLVIAAAKPDQQARISLACHPRHPLPSHHPPVHPLPGLPGCLRLRRRHPPHQPCHHHHPPLPPPPSPHRPHHPL